MSSASKPGEPPAGGPPLREVADLDATRRTERLAYFGLDTDDTCRLRACKPMAEAHVDRVVADFYAHLMRFPELATLLTEEPGRIAKLQGLQRDYFLSLTDGAFDADYFERRLRIGDAHQRIGLQPAWYIGAFALYLRLAIRDLMSAAPDGAAVLPTIEALVKAVFLDMSLAIDTYIFGGFVDRAVATELGRAARIAEEALYARAEVEQLKDELTSMVVHDLKNPVNGIAMMVQLALRKGQELPETQRGYLLQIERTCREMMRLIQNLLEISKIEEGKMPVAREPVVLAEVVDELASEYGPVAEQAGRRLEVAVGTELAPARADRALVKRVLVNLVVNALRHSGSAEVRIEGVLGPGPAEVTVAVVDHGHGFLPEEVGRIFEKFRTVRRSPSGDPNGDTGLGLPFCKLAVERMGGRITVASVPAVRTVFAVTLPIAS